MFFIPKGKEEKKARLKAFLGPDICLPTLGALVCWIFVTLVDPSFHGSKWSHGVTIRFQP